MEEWEKKLFMRQLKHIEKQYKVCTDTRFKLKIRQEVLFFRRLLLDKDSIYNK